MGHIGNHVSVRVARPLNPPKVTMAAFEAIDEAQEGKVMFGMTLGIVVEAAVAILLATDNRLLHRPQPAPEAAACRPRHAAQDGRRPRAGDQSRQRGDQGAEDDRASRPTRTLNARLEEAEKFGIELANHVTAGQQLMDKIAKITSAARRNSQPLEDRLAEPNKVQSALQQLAMRPRIRGNAA